VTHLTVRMMRGNFDIFENRAFFQTPGSLSRQIGHSICLAGTNQGIQLLVTRH
jgi:hypothetical protein